MTETRAEKAQRLVDEGQVGPVHTIPLVRWAFVQREHGHYLTTIYANGTFHCTCDWGQYHSYTDDLCAHALAVKLAAEKEKER